MGRDLVFVTGASGLLGYRVLVETLQHGYNVRAAVRSQEKAKLLTSAPSIQPYLTNLEVVVVPDLAAEGAYDDVLAGVTYILHSASSTSSETGDFDQDVVRPAVQSTLGILKSAAKHSNIKRIVMTSSEVAIVPWKQFFLEESDHVFRDTDTIEDKPTGPYGSYFEAYAASKALALHASNDFVKQEKPGYDVINIMPSFIVGKNELVTDPDHITDGTNGAAFGQIFGVRNPNTNPSTTVHLNDVALIHVLALDPKISGGQNFLVSSGGPKGTTWGDAIEIIRKHFPKEVAEGVFPLGGEQRTKSLKIDSSRTEEVFGIKLKSYEEQILSTANHYLDLLKIR